jgi:hypothetical protein
VKEHGQCETAPYRLLVGGGGTVWVQTKAALINALFVIAIVSLTATFFLCSVKEHGQCETAPYRLLVGGGGTVWVQTKAAVINARRGSNKGNSVLCRHAVIT